LFPLRKVGLFLNIKHWQLNSENNKKVTHPKYAIEYILLAIIHLSVLLHIAQTIIKKKKK